METSKKKKIALWVILILLVIGVWKYARFSALRPDGDLYQVVLLANDQAFYGKLHGVFSPYPYLTDVYYLNPQSPRLDDKGRPVGGAGQKFTVVKRGIDEIHQPTDRLSIARDKILYWENVGPDSLVARGIKADKEYRANLKKEVESKSAE